MAGPLNTSVAAYQVTPTNFDKESITQTNMIKQWRDSGVRESGMTQKLNRDKGV